MTEPSRATWLPQRPMRLPMKVSVVLAIALGLTLLALNQPLHTPQAPQGMISFQLAGAADQARAILDQWNGQGQAFARLALWLDFLFIVAYLAALLQLTRHFTRDRPGIRERRIARGVRVLFVMAALGDLAENVVLLNNFEPTDTLSSAAALLALAKYTGLVLAIAGLVIIRAARRHPLEPAG